MGLSFNIIANLILIPRFSYVAAAFVTILSELVEGLVFMIYLERSLGSIRWIRLLWRLFAAAGAMFVLMGLAWAWHPDRRIDRRADRVSRRRWSRSKRSGRRRSACSIGCVDHAARRLTSGWRNRRRVRSDDATTLAIR